MRSSSRLQRMRMRSDPSRSVWASMALVVASLTAMRRSSMRSSWNRGSTAAAAATTWRASTRYSTRAGISRQTSAIVTPRLADQGGTPLVGDNAGAGLRGPNAENGAVDHVIDPGGDRDDPVEAERGEHPPGGRVTIEDDGGVAAGLTGPADDTEH